MALQTQVATINAKVVVQEANVETQRTARVDQCGKRVTRLAGEALETGVGYGHGLALSTQGLPQHCRTSR